MFTDDYSRKIIGYLLKSMAKFLKQNFVEFQHLVKKQPGERDSGREYLNNSMSTFLKKNGILHKSQDSVHSTTEWSVRNRKLICYRRARSILHDSKLPLACWGQAINIIS